MDQMTLPFAQLVINLLGLPGLIFIIWHFDNKRLDKQREQYDEQHRLWREAFEAEHKKDRELTMKILASYRDDVSDIKGMYQNNAHLVGDYDKAMNRLEKLAEEMMSVVSLNAQTNTHLADAIKNNTFCPQMREMMGKK